MSLDNNVEDQTGDTGNPLLYRLSYTEDVDRELEKIARQIDREERIEKLIGYITAPFRAIYNLYKR